MLRSDDLLDLFLDAKISYGTFIAFLSKTMHLHQLVRLARIGIPLLLTLPMSAFAFNNSYTLHPWDFQERRVSSHRHLETNYDELYDYYYNSPDRSVTHALHPLNRRRYYNPRPYTFLGNHGLFGDYRTSEMYEYDATVGRWVRGDDVVKAPPKGVECRNYTFLRPNKRVPPFGYRCE